MFKPRFDEVHMNLRMDKCENDDDDTQGETYVKEIYEDERYRFLQITLQSFNNSKRHS